MIDSTPVNDKNIFVSYYELQQVFSQFYGIPDNEIVFCNNHSDSLTFGEIFKKLKNIGELKEEITIVNMGFDFDDGK